MNRLKQVSMNDFYLVGEHGVRVVENVYKVKENNLSFSPNVNGLSQFIQKSKSMKDLSFDETVTGRSIRAVSNERGVKLHVGQDSYWFTGWSLNQISSALNIPYRYAQEMIKTGKHELFNMNFESWINSHFRDKTFKLRFFGDTIRGALSTDYVAVDVDYLLPLIQSGLSKSNMSFKVDRGTMNPEFTNIRIISNQKIDIGGDPHYVGFRFTTSDVGQSVIKFEYFIFRERCSNGMFFGKKNGELFRKRHTAKELVNQYYVDDLIGDGLRNLDELITSTTNALESSQGKKVTDEDMQTIIDRFLTRTTFGKRRTEQFFQRVPLIASSHYEGRNLFSVANAITELAQELDIRSQEEAERFAGDLLFVKL